MAMRKIFWWAASAVLVLVGAGAGAATTNIYSAHFERGEGYDADYELIGQNGWITDSQSYGGNGIITNFSGTYAAYIGLFPLDPPDDHLAIWQPIDYSPLTAGFPIVKFSVLMDIIDSENDNYDWFYWSVYNRQTQPLFTLAFDVYYLDIGYLLDGTNDWVWPGIAYTTNTAYTLEVTMDFSRNQWSASLNERLLVRNQPITTTGADLDLGDIDAVWYIYDPNAPGDNFMIFDNYTITAESLPPASLSALGINPSGEFQLRVSGTDGVRYAVEASSDLLHWTPLETNTVTGSSFDFTDIQSSGRQQRFYRARAVP